MLRRASCTALSTERSRAGGRQAQMETNHLSDQPSGSEGLGMGPAGQRDGWMQAYGEKEALRLPFVTL